MEKSFENLGKNVNTLDVSNMEIPEDLKGINKDIVLKKAEKAWPEIMGEIRRQGRPHDEKGKINLIEGSVSWFTVPSSIREKGIDITCIDNKSCRHALRGGCTVCNYGGFKPSKKEDLKIKISEALKHIEETNKGYDFYYANLITPGSLFDPQEMPRKELYRIFEELASHKETHPSGIGFDTETRLEFVDEEVLKKMREILGDDAAIEIGYGLESINPLVREGIINKKLPDDFREKVDLLRKYNVTPINHVLVKPPFLTEKEAVDDATESICASLDQGLADTVIVMTTNIRPNTLTEKMSEDGTYKLANIWTVIEIMKRIGHDRAKKCKFLGFSVAPNSGAKIVTGCNEFNEKLMPLLLKYAGKKEDYEKIMEVAKEIETCESKKTSTIE